MKCGIHSVKSKNALDDLAWGEMTIVRHLRNEKAAGAEMRSTIDLFPPFFPSTFDMETLGKIGRHHRKERLKIS